MRTPKTKIHAHTIFDDAVASGAKTVVHLDRPLDIAPDGPLAYGVAELAAIVGDAAAALKAAGAGPGDHVAIVKHNHWDSDLLAFAAVRIGAVPAKIRADLSPDAIAVLLGRLRPAVTVTTTATLAAATAAGIDLVALSRRTLAIDGAAPGAVALDDLRGEPVPSPVDRSDDEPLIICPTSGTTGVPKLAVHTVGTIIRALAQFEAQKLPFFGCQPEDVVATASAFSHGRTFCWSTVAMTMAPREIVIISDHDPARAEPLLRAHRPTIMEGIPATFVRWTPMATAAGNPFEDVHLYVSTYDAIHPPAVRAFLTASRRKRVVFMHGWGETETGPLTFRFFTRKALEARGGLHPTTRDQGMPTPIKTRLKVVDPQTFEKLPRGRPGVLMTRTKALCHGYVGEQERFDEKLSGGWFNTGDVGIITRKGNVIFVDREVDEIPGLSCVEVEDVIDDRLDEVLECIVLGTPGQLPVPVVVTAAGALDEAAWAAATKDLPKLAAPVVRTWDEIPRTGTGKVRRLALRALLEEVAATHGSGRWT